MLTCITCSKQRREDSREDAKDAVKSLTNQIKDMAFKVSGSNKAEMTLKNDRRSYPDFDTVSKGVVPYTYVSSSSNSAWDFPTTRLDSRLNAVGLESISAKPIEVGLEAQEWTAQVEPGVHITFATLPLGGNDLKRIRFSREMFNKWEAQRWWGENYDRVMELYNVQRFNQQALNSTPGRSEDGRDSTFSRLGSTRESPRVWTPRYRPQGSFKGEMPYMEASGNTNCFRDDAVVSISNGSEIESEWIEEDEPGVYITVRQLVDGTRELRRVRFSREKFGGVHAKMWWETNRDRIQTQYLC